MYKDCVSLINQMTNLVSVINSNRILFVDHKGRRSSTGVATAWEIRTCLRLAARDIKGPLNESEWRGRYKGNNIEISRGTGNKKEVHLVPVSKVDEIDREEELDKMMPRRFYRTPDYDFSYPSPSGNEIPQRTLLQSFDDLSNLIKVLGTLVATVGAVKSGVFATSIKNAVSKLSNSKRGLEQASKDIKTAVEQSKKASR